MYSEVMAIFGPGTVELPAIIAGWDWEDWDWVNGVCGWDWNEDVGDRVNGLFSWDWDEGRMYWDEGTQWDESGVDWIDSMSSWNWVEGGMDWVEGTVGWACNESGVDSVKDMFSWGWDKDGEDWWLVLRALSSCLWDDLGLKLYGVKLGSFLPETFSIKHLKTPRGTNFHPVTTYYMTSEIERWELLTPAVDLPARGRCEWILWLVDLPARGGMFQLVDWESDI